jgi:hypothetical protein
MEAEEEIRLLEKRLSDLKVEYEKYFTGIERIEPAKLRDEVQRLVRRVGTFHINNTALRFKRDNLIAQFNSYNQYCNRILKKIEDGTYSRDLFKMNLKARMKTQQPPSPHPSSPQGKSPPSGGEYDSVFKKLISTKEKLGESTKNMNYSIFEDNLKKQSEAIKKKYSVSRVDFEIEQKNGKAIIKAVPKK